MKTRKLWNVFILTMLLAMVFGMSSLAAPRVVTLKNNITYTNTTDGESYYKIVVPTTGYLEVTGYRNYTDEKIDLMVQICNSKKQALENPYTSCLSKKNSWKVYYGVNKGTYYLKATGKKYILKYSFKSVKESYGSTRAKAVSIVKNKTKYGILAFGETGAEEEWYKIKFTKAEKLKLQVCGRGSGYVGIEIVPADRKVVLRGACHGVWNAQRTITSRKAMPKGTYYIRVFRLTGKPNSGYYTLKWM